jgi:hypothetical protein
VPTAARVLQARQAAVHHMQPVVLSESLTPAEASANDGL